MESMTSRGMSNRIHHSPIKIKSRVKSHYRPSARASACWCRLTFSPIRGNASASYPRKCVHPRRPNVNYPERDWMNGKMNRGKNHHQTPNENFLKAPAFSSTLCWNPNPPGGRSGQNRAASCDKLISLSFHRLTHPTMRCFVLPVHRVPPW